MPLVLSNDLEKLVGNQISSGRYQTPEQVLGEALRLLRCHEDIRERKLQDLSSELQIGIDQLDSGEFTEYDESNIHELAEDIKRRGRKALTARSKGK
jgi:putative addiction module CopG family antidote